MSGPWDRPSSPGSDDRDRSDSDRETPSFAEQPADPWSSEDPWQASRPDSTGWDDWPSPAPPPDEYIDEPGPTTDLWSEAWDVEAAEQGAVPSYTEPVPADSPSADEPSPSDEPPPSYEPPPSEEPAPAYEPPLAYQAAPDAAAEEAEPAVPEAGEPQLVEPWQPAGDPWGLAADDAWGAPAAGTPAIEPDWLAEPSAEVAATPPDEPGLEIESAAWSVEPELEAALSQPEAPPAPPEVEPESEPPEAPMPEPGPPLTPTPEPEPMPEPQPEAEPMSEPQPESEPVPVEPVADAVAAPEAVPQAAVEEPEPEPAASAEELDAAAEEAALEELAREEAEAAAAREPLSWLDAGGTVPPFLATDDAVEPEGPAEPEIPAAASAVGVPAEPLTLPPDDSPDPWPDEDADSTRVLPASWAPVVTERRPDQPLTPEAGDIRTRLRELEEEEERERARVKGSTAEAAVPWLIGFILLLAGMVIVLLALIFAGNASLGGGAPSPTASVLAAVPSATPRPSATPVPSRDASSEPTPTPTPEPVAEWGPLEMIYQGRAAALAPIYLLLHDFTTEDDPVVLAQDPNLDVRRFAWASDGRVGVGLLADVLVSIEPGESKRNLGDGIVTVTFGDDATTVYAVRLTTDGSDDIATLVAIDFESGDSRELGSVRYPTPEIGAEAALPEAQFTDDGGPVRLFWMHEGWLRLWVLGGGAWRIDPESGDATEIEGGELPILLDEDGRHRIELTEDEGTTTLHYINSSDVELATTRVDGLVSHVRWSPGGDRVVFTVGRSTSGGGVLQDLFLWDLQQAPGCSPEPGSACQQITTTGAAFGASWRGGFARWEEG